jgi:hypothetical protein
VKDQIQTSRSSLAESREGTSPAQTSERSSPLFVLPAEGVDIDIVILELLEQALERTGGNQRMAGALLGINRDQVRYRIAKYGLHPHRARAVERAGTLSMWEEPSTPADHPTSASARADERWAKRAEPEALPSAPRELTLVRRAR